MQEIKQEISNSLQFLNIDSKDLTNIIIRFTGTSFQDLKCDLPEKVSNKSNDKPDNKCSGKLILIDKCDYDNSINCDKHQFQCEKCKAYYTPCIKCSDKSLEQEFEDINQSNLFPIVLCQFMGHNAEKCFSDCLLVVYQYASCDCYISHEHRNLKGIRKDIIEDYENKLYHGQNNKDNSWIYGDDGGRGHDWKCNVCDEMYSYSDK